MLIFSDDGDVSCEKILKHWLDSGGDECLTGKWTELGVALVRDKKKTTATIIVGAGRTSPHSGVVIWENMKKQFFSQSHALNLVDVNGDGLKDLVTGRRWWAHGPAGDAAPTEPAYLFWLEARKSGDGIVTFFPHLIDDDSGIGTQFACEDINGDGIPDVIISNKKGVFVFEQVRVAARKEN
ncbi:MAG: VCBS repeat-containing protein [Planctomycetes bacterium]|nr:VCBS repeat-containing protein [Planctomycetota bacterium]